VLQAGACVRVCDTAAEASLGLPPGDLCNWLRQLSPYTNWKRSLGCFWRREAYPKWLPRLAKRYLEKFATHPRHRDVGGFLLHDEPFRKALPKIELTIVVRTEQDPTGRMDSLCLDDTAATRRSRSFQTSATLSHYRYVAVPKRVGVRIVDSADSPNPAVASTTAMPTTSPFPEALTSPESFSTSLRCVVAIIQEESFAANIRKTRVMRQGTHQHLAGLAQMQE